MLTERYSKVFWFSYVLVNLYTASTIFVFTYFYASGSDNTLTGSPNYILNELSIRLAISCTIFIIANIYFLRGGKMATPIVFIAAWIWVDFLSKYFAPEGALFNSMDSLATIISNSRLIFVLLITYLAVELNVREKV